MRICYFGTYERDYPRNSVIIHGLREQGVSVTECHGNLWGKKEDKTNLSIFDKLLLVARMPIVYLDLIVSYRKLTKKNDFDAIIVGYPGQLDMFIAHFIAGKTKIVFNPMVSLHDTLVLDRKIVKNSFVKSFLRFIDRKSCEFADLVVLDTEDHELYFRKEFGLDNVGTLYIGADNMFDPKKVKKSKKLQDIQKGKDNPFNILYYGKYTPLQGIEYIVRAAKELQKDKANKDIHIEIIGNGQTHSEIVRLAYDLGVQNITFTDWIAYKDLPQKIADADICLGGHFGAGQKALRVVPNKVFQIIAMGCPVIVNDGLALRRTGFKDKENCLAIPVKDPAAIAKAIKQLVNDTTLRSKISVGARRLFIDNFSTEMIINDLIAKIDKLNKDK